MSLSENLIRFHQLQKDYLCAERTKQIVAWDWRTLTPKKAASGRSEVLGFTSAIQKKLLCAKTSLKVLDELNIHRDELNQIDRACVRILKRRAEKASRIPKALFEQFSVAQGKSEAVWERAKRTNDWQLFQPHLEKMFDLSKRIAEKWRFEGGLYDAFLDSCEEGMTVEKLDGLFNELKEGILPLADKVRRSNQHIDDGFLQARVPIEVQRQTTDMLLKEIGFDRSRGLIAESEHPYTCAFGLDDVRLTTHYYEDRYLSAVFSTLHEGGHGLYEQGYERALDGTLAGCGLASGMHESVSRFWENRVGRSLAFWQYMMPKFRHYLNEQLGHVTALQMYRAVNKCGCSLTRMGSDELNYNLHVMLRYELERDVFEGRIQASELRKLWNQKTEEYLGIQPSDDTVGILQDIQWSMAQFGYFPSYALGNMYNAQYSQKMKTQLPFDDLLARGNLAKVRSWMQEYLFAYGSLYTPDEMIRRLTGSTLSASPLVQYLQEKFTSLYGLE